VLVVEHDEETIRRADYVIDIGPAAGVHGGEIIAVGTPEEVACNPNSSRVSTSAGRGRSTCPPSDAPRTVTASPCAARANTTSKTST
jgi:excinuclease ABC subunit A